MARSEKLLTIQPQELSFCFELMKQASCTIRLSSNSPSHVAFKVMTTSPEKYFVKPHNGILLPGSTLDIEVNMRALKEIPPNMECKDKFLIKSLVASPDDTVETSRKLQPFEIFCKKLSLCNRKEFKDRGRAVEECKLGVMYVVPSHDQLSSNLDRSGQGSSPKEQILQKRSSSGTQVQGKSVRLVDNLFVKGIAILLLILIFLYLIMKILPIIWSSTFLVSVLVIKMVQRLVSDSVEDWVVKTLVYACNHFFSVIFQRIQQIRA